MYIFRIKEKYQKKNPINLKKNKNSLKTIKKNFLYFEIKFAILPLNPQNPATLPEIMLIR